MVLVVIWEVVMVMEVVTMEVAMVLLQLDRLSSNDLLVDSPYVPLLEFTVPRGPFVVQRRWLLQCHLNYGTVWIVLDVLLVCPLLFLASP